MKPTRIAKLLAVVLVIAMLPLWLFSCGNKLSSNVTSALTETIVGNGKLSKKDTASEAYLAQLDAEADELSLNYQGGKWSSKYMTTGDTERVAHYKYTYKLALAWGTKGSAHYHNSATLEKIKTALEVGYANYFGELLIKNNGGTTATEREHCSLYLIKTLMIVQSKLKKADIENYLSIVQLKFPAPVGEGMDLLRTTYIVVATNALLGEKDIIEKYAGGFLEDSIAVVESGNGRYSDGSFIWKLNVTTLEEGVEAASIIADLYYAFKGTDCDLGTVATDALYNWVVSSMQYSIYNGTAMSSALSFSVSEGSRMGGEAVAVMLKIAKLCGGEQETAINSLVKAYGNAEKKEFEKYLGSYGAELYASVMKNEKITASDTALGAHSYAMADSLTVLGSKFALSVSMTSIRTNKYESAEYPNEENQLTLGGYNGDLWFVRDGMITLYTEDYQIPSNYWSYVNKNRLPGTTVDNRDRNDSYTISYNGITNYAGSAVYKNSAVAAMIATGNNSEFYSDMSAKKSWFIFGDKIVCLGADIKNSTTPNTVKDTYNIETVIENIYFGKKNNVYFSTEDDGVTVTNRETVLNPGSALFVSSYGLIYIPESNGSTAKMVLNSTDGGNYLELWLEHGATPNGATYEYAIYPSTTAKKSSLYEKVASGDYTVLSNTGDVQAVKDNTSGQVGYTFWKGASCNGITTDFACTMMVTESDGKIVIAISDFSHNSFDNAGGTITLDGNYSLSSADDGLSFSGNTITVNRELAEDGHTMVIVLNK